MERVIKMPHGKMLYVISNVFLCLYELQYLTVLLYRVSIVRYNPAIPDYYAHREMFGLERRSSGLDRGGN